MLVGLPTSEVYAPYGYCYDAAADDECAYRTTQRTQYTLN